MSNESKLQGLGDALGPFFDKLMESDLSDEEIEIVINQASSFGTAFLDGKIHPKSLKKISGACEKLFREIVSKCSDSSFSRPVS